MKLIAVCFVLVVSRCALAQTRDCIQEKDKLMKCKKDVLISADSKNVQEQSRKNIDKCLGKDSVSKCLIKSDECHSKADSTASSSPLKQQADTNAAKCFRNQLGGPSPGMPLVQQGQGMQGQGMQGGPQAPPNAELHPVECMMPLDPKVSECMDVEESKLDNSLVKKLDGQMKECHKSLSQECMPRHPAVGMCLHQAYVPVMNLTLSTYRQCMKEAGYNFSNTPQMPHMTG